MRYLLIGLLAGCGGGSSSNLDCEYLASEENCFKVTTTTAASCLPPDGELGMLSADNATCTYTTGQVITFTPPLVLPVDNDAPWNFTVTTNGQPCLEYSDDDNGFTLTVGGDTVEETITNGTLELSCPDGSSFSNSNPLALLSCPTGDFGDLPGNASGSGATSVQFSFINTGADSALTVFNCQK